MTCSEIWTSTEFKREETKNEQRNAEIAQGNQ